MRRAEQKNKVLKLGKFSSHISVEKRKTRDALFYLHTPELLYLTKTKFAVASKICCADGSAHSL